MKPSVLTVIGLTAAPTAFGQAAQAVPVPWYETHTALVGVGGLAIVLTYYLVLWITIGNRRFRMNVKGRPVPPTDLSPAALRFVIRMGYDDKTIASAILSMAVKGYLYIDDTEPTVMVVRDEARDHVLAADEAVLARFMFDGRDAFPLSWSNRRKLAALQRRLRDKLDSDYAGSYFHANTPWRIAGLIITTAVMITVFVVHIQEFPGSEGVRRLLDFFIGAGLIAFGPFIIIREYRNAKAGRASRWQWTLGGVALVSIALGVAFIYDAGTAIYQANFMSGLVVFLVLCAVNAFFMRRLPRYTKIGYPIVREVEGFRKNLQEVRPTFAPEEDAQRLFEVFLPYAVALDQGEHWAGALTETIEAADPDNQQTMTNSPVWYAGPKWEHHSPGEFVAALTHTLVAAVNSTAAPASQDRGGLHAIRGRHERQRSEMGGRHED